MTTTTLYTQAAIAGSVTAMQAAHKPTKPNTLYVLIKADGEVQAIGCNVSISEYTMLANAVLLVINRQTGCLIHKLAGAASNSDITAKLDKLANHILGEHKKRADQRALAKLPKPDKLLEQDELIEMTACDNYPLAVAKLVREVTYSKPNRSSAASTKRSKN